MSTTTSQPLTIGKSYLISDVDLANFPPPPRGKRMLIVNGVADLDSIAAMIATGIATIFTQGCILDYTYQDTSGGIHGHIFTNVKDNALIGTLEAKVLLLVRYQLQQKSGQVNPHNIGKSSRSTIWTNKPLTENS